MTLRIRRKFDHLSSGLCAHCARRRKRRSDKALERGDQHINYREELRRLAQCSLAKYNGVIASVLDDGFGIHITHAEGAARGARTVDIRTV